MDLFFTQLPQHIANGLSLGAVYALVALGYSLVYGVLRLLNFAHGDVFMVGAFVGYALHLPLARDAGLPGWLALLLMLPATMLTCGLLGVLIERLAYRPLSKAHKLAPLLSALGVSFVLQNAMLLLAGARHRALQPELLLAPELGLELFGARISASRLLLLLTAIVLLIGLYLVVHRSSLGRSMRAIAADREAAAMLGINVNRVVSWTFFLSSALAGAAGLLVALVFTRVWHLMGLEAGLKGFTAAVLGGIGSLPGSLAGGLLLGLAESLGAGLISATYSDIIVFAVLILTLLLRPAGLFGRRSTPKV